MDRIMALSGVEEVKHCPVAPDNKIQGPQREDWQIRASMLRESLGEHGPAATPSEITSYAAFLLTGGAVGSQRVSGHILESPSIQNSLQFV